MVASAAERAMLLVCTLSLATRSRTACSSAALGSHAAPASSAFAALSSGMHERPATLAASDCSKLRFVPFFPEARASAAAQTGTVLTLLTCSSY